MFEGVELGAKMEKAEYDRLLPSLRSRLVQTQFKLREKGVPLLIVIAGMDGAGKGEIVNHLHDWLDARGMDTHVFWEPTDEEKLRPEWWKYWMSLPSRGRMGVFFGGWYQRPLVSRAYGRIKRSALDSALRHISNFERMLALDGAVILKFWCHLSREAQKDRLKELEKHSALHWRLLPKDWKHHKMYPAFAEAAAEVISQTDIPQAPWRLIEAGDERYRNFTVGRTLLEVMQGALRVPRKPRHRPAKLPTTKPVRSILGRVDLVSKIGEKEYRPHLERLQFQISRRAWKANEKGRTTILLFEGWDAAGKGGSIRRVTEALDARLYTVVPIAAPTDEERARHYLWRFWRHLPRDGRLVIFDRSWYGRVLVERVEGYATAEEWKRAYLEINDFEEQLVRHGSTLMKFWLHISPEEQMRRFKEREEIPYKRHKITDEDWRNRAKWNQYEAAVNEMVARTSTTQAPWTLVGANDKKSARIQVLETVAERLKLAD